MRQCCSFSPLLEEEDSNNTASGPRCWGDTLNSLSYRQLGSRPCCHYKGSGNRNWEQWVTKLEKAHSRRCPPAIRPWSLSSWFIVKRIKSPRRCLRCTQRHHKGWIGTGSPSELPGTSLLSSEQTPVTAVSFQTLLPSLHVFIHIHVFPALFLHCSSVQLYLMVSFTFFPVLCSFSSVVQFLSLPSMQLPMPSGLFLPTGTLTELDTQGSFCSCCFLIPSSRCSFFLVLCSILSASGVHREGWEWPGMSW